MIAAATGAIISMSSTSSLFSSSPARRADSAFAIARRLSSPSLRSAAHIALSLSLAEPLKIEANRLFQPEFPLASLTRGGNPERIQGRWDAWIQASERRQNVRDE
jgi:hypothetical protein